MEESFCPEHKLMDSIEANNDSSDPITIPLSNAIHQYNDLLSVLKNIHKQTGKHLFCTELKQLKNKVNHVKEEHEKLKTKTSKVNMFMGPIGATATVLKELDLEKELKHIAEYLNVVLRNLSQNIKKRQYKKLFGFEDIIQQNKEMLEELL